MIHFPENENVNIKLFMKSLSWVREKLVYALLYSKQNKFKLKFKLNY